MSVFMPTYILQKYNPPIYIPDSFAKLRMDDLFQVFYIHFINAMQG